MAMLKYLLENLENSQEVYVGQRGKWESFFKVDGCSYGFKAEAIAGEKIDAPMWELKLGSLSNDRLDKPEYPKNVIAAFVEVTKQFIKEICPFKFYIVGSGSYGTIADVLKKEISGFSVIDERESKDGCDCNCGGNLVGRIIFTKEDTREVDPNTNPDLSDNEKTFSIYDLPKDIEKKIFKLTDKFDTGNDSYNDREI
jgi:hypothetical protein